MILIWSEKNGELSLTISLLVRQVRISPLWLMTKQARQGSPLVDSYIKFSIMTLNLGPGSIATQPGYVNKRTGTMDSTMGEIASSKSKLVIQYDIGGMAGTHMYPTLAKDCVWFQIHEVNGLTAMTGILAKGKTRQIITTIGVDQCSGDPKRYPVNFWGIVNTDSDTAEFLLIVCSYQPNETDKPQ